MQAIDALCHRQHFIPVMAGHQYATAFAQPRQQRAQGSALVAVETVGRLIQHQQRRTVNQRLRQTDTLPITMRQLAAAFVRHRLQMTAGDDVVHRRFDISHAAHLCAGLQKFAHPPLWIEWRLVRQITQPETRQFVVIAHRAAIRRQRAGQDFQQGRFARAIAANQRDHFPRAQFKRGVAQNGLSATAEGKVLGGEYRFHDAADIKKTREGGF